MLRLPTFSSCLTRQAAFDYSWFLRHKRHPSASQHRTLLSFLESHKRISVSIVSSSACTFEHAPVTSLCMRFKADQHRIIIKNLRYSTSAGHSLLWPTLRIGSEKPQQDERVNRPDKTFPNKQSAGEEKNDGNSDGGDEDPFRNFMRLLTRIFVAVVVVAFLSSLLGTDKHSIDPNAAFVSWNEFVSYMLTRGEVRQIVIRPEARIATITLHENAVINGRRTDRTRYYLNIGQSAGELLKFEERLREIEDKLGIDPRDRVQVVYVRDSGSDWVFLMALIAIAVSTFYMFGRTKKRSGTGGGIGGSGGFSMPNPFQAFTRARFTLIDPLIGEGRGVRLKDVAGMREAKQEVMEFVDYLRSPEKYARLGAKVPKGALLLGPPGCGKTLLAKAVATEAKVPFLSMNGSEFIEMIGGLGAARVRDLFKQARRRAPCIIYIDEIDALGRQRGGVSSFAGSTGEEEQTLNQLLVEMDGIGTQAGVLLLASTNRPDILDKALLRPGRFDRQITIEMPTPIERKEIFDLYLRKVKLEKDSQLHLLAQRMALMTAGMSGADIFNVVNEAALYAATGGGKVVKRSDFEYALDKVFRGSEKRSSAISPHEKRMRAYYLSGQCLAGWYLEHTDALLRISIKPRTLGFGFAQHMNREQKLFTKEQLVDRMTMSLAGRAAELDVFKHSSTSAESDLKKVTDIAYKAIKTFGMSERVGLLSFPDTADDKFSIKPYSKSLGNLIDLEARQLLGHAFQRANEVIQKNKDKVETLAEALTMRETLTFAEVEELIGPSPWGKKQLIESINWDSLIQEFNATSAESNVPPATPPAREDE